MNEHDVSEMLKDERKENCVLFMKTAAFWKTVVTGIVIIVGLTSGVVGWGFHVHSTVAVNKSAIVRIEKTMNGKLDAILVEVRKK